MERSLRDHQGPCLGPADPGLGANTRAIVGGCSVILVRNWRVSGSWGEQGSIEGNYVRDKKLNTKKTGLRFFHLTVRTCNPKLALRK